MAFFYAIDGLFTIIIIVCLGYFLTAKQWFNGQNAELIPQLVNYVALPAYLIWNLITTFDQSKILDILYGISVPALSMLITFGISMLVSNLLKVAPNRKGIFRSVFFCSSAVFIGIPVNLALFGETSIPYVLLYFLVNAFLFWTLGNYSISTDGGIASAKIISRANIRRIFSPPFIGFMVGVALILLGINLPHFIINTLKHLGNMTPPLSMLFIGIAIFGVKLKEVKISKEIIAVLIGRFIIAPVVVLLVTMIIPIPDLMRKVFVIQASLPAMTQIAILAKVYEADAEYAAVLVTLTTILAILVIPFYMFVI
jgi:hypothetical protein